MAGSRRIGGGPDRTSERDRGRRPIVPFDMNLRTHKRATYETLRDMIVSFELPPGERLVEKDLAARLGVSKTPVREALALLEADGLVEATPYRGAIVRWLSRNEIVEQGFLVDALEMPAYEIVVERITDAELAAIDKVGQGARPRAARPQRDGASASWPCRSTCCSSRAPASRACSTSSGSSSGRSGCATTRRSSTRSTSRGTPCWRCPWPASRPSARATRRGVRETVAEHRRRLTGAQRGQPRRPERRPLLPATPEPASRPSLSESPPTRRR